MMLCENLVILTIYVLCNEKNEFKRTTYMMFRIIRGHYRSTLVVLFTLCNSSTTRGRKFKLMKQFCRINSRVFSF